MSFNFLMAVKRPLMDFNKLSIGVILILLPTLLFAIMPSLTALAIIISVISIVLGFLVRGYKFESARTVLKKDFKMPEWKNWNNLFIKGFLGWLIGVIYMIPAIILILISVGKMIYNLIAQYGLSQGLNIESAISNQLIQNGLLQNTLMLPVFIIGILTALLAAYLMPIAILRYLEKNKFKEAFELKLIFKKGFTGPYFIALLVSIVYGFVIGLVSGALMLGFKSINLQIFGTIIGLIIGGLSSFMIMITSYTILAEAYSKIK